MWSAVQSMLNPAGIQATRIERLWWIQFWICTAVFVAVMVAVVMAVRRGRSRQVDPPDERSLARAVIAATVATVVILIGVLVAAAATDRAIGSLVSPQPLAIDVTGYQWWWKIEYVYPRPDLRATTANELHVPVGRPIAITLRSADVIHSFWVPNIHGKMDLVPGRVNTLWIRVDKPGVYRGQCAEYCGLQHANMALTVVAEAPHEYEQWISAQRQAASDPATPEQTRGRAVVEQGPCALCHTIRGTIAGGRTAPDLTHFATRSTIAAGTVPNTRGYLGGWIADPQHIKPGSRMPSTGLSSEELQAVIAYVESLR
jgi:cytochrome c oxidase subunit 2